MEFLTTAAGICGDLVVPPLSPVAEVGKKPDRGVPPDVPADTLVPVSCGAVGGWKDRPSFPRPGETVVCEELLGFPKTEARCEIGVGVGIVCLESLGFPKMGADCEGIPRVGCGEKLAGFPKMEAGCKGVVEVDVVCEGCPKMEAGCKGAAAVNVGCAGELAGSPKMGAGCEAIADAGC